MFRSYVNVGPTMLYVDYHMQRDSTGNRGNLSYANYIHNEETQETILITVMRACR